MTTLRQLITGSLRLIEQVGSGEEPTAEESSDALFALNAMVDSWSIDGNKVWTQSQDTLTLTPGVDVYTIGIGGTINTTLPSRIYAATVEIPNSVSTSLEIFSAEEYAYQNDTFISGRPTAVYYERGYPTGTLTFYYKPNAAYLFTMYSTKQLSTFSNLSDTLSLPAGLERALRYNLAIEIAPEYGKAVPQAVVAIAIESKTSIEAQIGVLDKNTMQVDDALATISDGSSFNILAGR